MISRSPGVHLQVIGETLENWLIDISSTDMWTASRMVSGAIPDGGRTRVPTLVVKDPATGAQRTIADNAEKGKTFYKTFFPPKPATSSVPPDPQYPPPAWEFVNIDEEQIHRAIRKMKPYKGTRTGTWPNVVFQKTADDIVPHLTPIFRAVFNLGIYHEDWAVTGTLAHRKPGKADYTAPEAWRPIVLSSPCGRLLNSCVRDQVSTMAERRGIFPSHHFGGRPGRNTTDALHLLLKVVWDAWRRGKVASVLSLDVKGAFPSTDVERLQHNMRMRGIPKKIVDYMGRWLACRKTWLIFDDYISEEFVVDAGLDQGDPFSLTAYLLYNSDHLSIANPRDGEHIFMFIDDTTIVMVGDTFKETHAKLRNLMEKEGGIFAWAAEHNCVFGTNKFQLLDASRRRQPDPDNPRKQIPIQHTSLALRGLEIPSRQCITLLGVQIDNELRWKQQGAVSIKKGQDWIIQFGRLSRASKGIATKYMRQLYIAVALPRMLYAADIFLPPMAADPTRGGDKRRRGGQATLTKLTSVQRKAAIAISGAMSTTAGDAAEIHAGLLPMRLYVSATQHQAALHMSTLPKAHPMSKAITNARARRTKRHTTRINDLIWTFDLDPGRLEKVEAVRHDVGWKTKLERRITDTKEKAIAEEKTDTADIKVYMDGSGFEGKVGAAAVLQRKGGRGWRTRRLGIGKAEQHEVFEGETAGLALAMDMVREEKRVREVSVYTDNQAAITATGTDTPGSARHIVEMIHALHRRLMAKHSRARVTIHWIPSHSDVCGNEKADAHAKRAAKGDVSPPDNLPACLRKALPISKAAVRRMFRKRLTAAAASMWRASPRYPKFRQIDPTLSIPSFQRITKDMPKCQSAVLVQLRTGHLALNQHLYRIGKVDTPVCPCCQQEDETVYHFLLWCLAHAIT